MQAIIIFTILSLFQISVAIKLTESKLSRCLVTMNSASDFGRLVRSPRSVAITASLSVLFLSQPISESILAQIPSLQTIAPSTVCHADSTGKFSTKLTARKRYLPRIVTGVTEFRSLLSQPTAADFTKYGEETLPGLTRAMSLYGASLRKGEVPDEISRTADRLTQVFSDKYKGAGVAARDDLETVRTKLGSARSALEDYLKFASLCPIDCADYAQTAVSK